jgi:uncharacterized protein YecE (DUF72 family)
MHAKAGVRRSAAARRGALWIGTSGWVYGDWQGRFYPPKLTPRRHLEFYSRVFPTVEINSTFYHLPLPSTMSGWEERTPKGFLFSVKLSRYITHRKKLSGVRESVRLFLSRARLLGSKLGPVLVQLPPQLHANPARLDRFLAGTRQVAGRIGLSTIRMAVEFRHPSWFEAPTLDVLTRHSAALVLAHSSRYLYPADEPLTTDWTYLRFHGPAGMFASPYGRKRLEPWGRKIRRWRRQGRDVFAYFNNDFHAHAVRDASLLMGLVTGREPRRPASAQLL